MEADISIWHKPGHFYFALTSVRVFEINTCGQTATPFAVPFVGANGSIVSFMAGVCRSGLLPLASYPIIARNAFRL